MSTQAATAEGTEVGEHSPTRPYAPSWVDALVGWIERLPGPTWAAYIVLAVLAAAFVALEATLSSRGLFGQDPTYFGYAFFHIHPLAAYCYLSRGATAAWDAFRPATDLDDAAAYRMRLELSTTPARPAALLYLVGVAGFLAMMAMAPEGFDLLGHQPTFVALRVLTGCSGSRRWHGCSVTSSFASCGSSRSCTARSSPWTCSSPGLCTRCRP